MKPKEHITRPRLLLFSIIVLGAALRIYKLDNQSFWFDEVLSIRIMERNLESLLLWFDTMPPLYFILLHLWSALGKDEFVLRLLSAVLGTISIAVIYSLGKEILDRRHGLVAAALLAFSPFHVWYSQETRAYALHILLTMCSVLFFLRFLRRGKITSGLMWLVTTFLSLYTFYHAALVLAFEVFYYFLSFRSAKVSLKLFSVYLASLLVAILYIEYLMVVKIGAIESGDLAASPNPVSIFTIPYTLFAFCLGFSYGPNTSVLHQQGSFASLFSYAPQLFPALLFFSFCFISGVWALARTRRTLLVVLYACVPIVGAAAVSLLLRDIPFQVRYVSAAFPAFILIVTSCILSPRIPVLRWAAPLAIVSFFFLSLYNHYTDEDYYKPDYRAVGDLLDAHGRSGDIIIAMPMIPLKYYYYKGDIPIESIHWTRKYTENLDRKIKGFRRAWLVMSTEWLTDPSGKIESHMKSRYPTVMETSFPQIRIVLYEMESA